MLLPGLRRWGMILGLVYLLGNATSVSAETINFNDLGLAPGSYWNGSDLSGTPSAGPWGSTVYTGGFQSGGASFANSFNSDWQSWSGFAYSNMANTTEAGYLNQYSVYAGAGASGSGDAFGIAFGNQGEPIHDAGDLSGLPNFILPSGAALASAMVANTTYAALSMRDGDAFAMPFGLGDWFLLTAYGTDAAGTELRGTAEIYLVDFRSAVGAISNQWMAFDLSALGLAHAERVFFNLTSSDVGPWGMNTPAYFAIDDIAFGLAGDGDVVTTPEPTAMAMWALLAASGAGMGWWRRRQS